MTTHISEEVTRLAIQNDLGNFQKEYRNLGANLPPIVSSGVFLLLSLTSFLIGLALQISVPPDDWGNFSPLGGVIIGLVFLALAALFFFPAFFDLAYRTYVYDNGFICFNKRKRKVICVLHWSDIKSIYFSFIGKTILWYVINNHNESFLIRQPALRKLCKEAAAKNYESSHVMKLSADGGTYTGEIRVEKATGRKNERIETIVVHRQVYEDELTRKGREVELSEYWLPRYNGATVYIRGKQEPSTAAWVLLGDPPDPSWANVPSDAQPTLEQVTICVLSLPYLPKDTVDPSRFREEDFRQRLLTILKQQNEDINDPVVQQAVDNIITTARKQIQGRSSKV